MSPLTLTLLLGLGCDNGQPEDSVDTGCEDPGTWYLDGDEDGFGEEAVTACVQPEGSVDDNTDCDDNDSDVFPGADELCNGEDDDCDGEVDEPDAVDAEMWYPDADLDGYGDSTAGEAACEAPTDYIADGTDCDDTNAAVNPAAVEICNAIDDDCDAGTPEAGLAHFIDDATGTMTDMSTALAGSPGSPAMVELLEDGELTLCEGDWFVALDVQANVEVHGVGDPAAVVLNGGGGTDPIFLMNAEGLDVGFFGLTMSNGVATYGSAVYCADGTESSTVRMRHVAVDGFGDAASYTYGPLYLVGCSTVFDNVELSNNEGYYYAAALGYYGDHEWSDVEVFGNHADQAFGGVYLGGGDTVFDEVSFTDNSADYAISAFGFWGGNLTWTGSESTGSGLTSNTDAQAYGALYLADATASFVDVDFGTSDAGDDNSHADIFVADNSTPYEAEDDETFICDQDGCGSADSAVISSYTGLSYIFNDDATANVFLAEADGLTISSPAIYGYGDGCTLDHFIATKDSLDTGEWEILSMDVEAADYTSSPGWNDGTGGAITEAGMYYAVGFGVRNCSSGYFQAGYEYATDNDGIFGQAVGYIFDTTYSYGVLDVDYAYTTYMGPWYQTFDVTDL